MRRASLALAVACAVVLAGCTVGGVSCNPAPQEYRCDFAGSGKVLREDAWGNSAPTANVTIHAGGVGDVNVTIRDHDGARVLNRTFSIEGGGTRTATTAAGEPGTWTVRIEGDYTGGMDIRIANPNASRSGFFDM